MVKSEVEKIIVSERLKGYNFFEDRSNHENEIVISFYGGKYHVYATDERASKIMGSERFFETENEALENFIRRLRALNILKSNK